MDSKASTATQCTGSVYTVSQHDEVWERVGFPHLNVSGSVTDCDGYCQAVAEATVPLRGIYCDVRHHNEITPSALGQLVHIGPVGFDWNDSLDIGANDARLRDLMAYYHISRALHCFRSFFESDEIERDAPHCFSGLQVIVDRAAPEWAESAMWVPNARQIVFGAAVAYALDSAISYHECAHAVIDYVTGSQRFPNALDPLTGKRLLAAATCEAYADFLGCSLKGESIILAGDSSQRDLGRPCRYDAALTDAYDISLCLSTALWRIRRRLSADKVNRLVLDTLRSTRRGPLSSFTIHEAARCLYRLAVDHGWGADDVGFIVKVFNKHRLGD